jgi:hypothetical protein
VLRRVGEIDEIGVIAALVTICGRIIREFSRGEADKATVMHWVAGGVATSYGTDNAVEPDQASAPPV